MAKTKLKRRTGRPRRSAGPLAVYRPANPAMLTNHLSSLIDPFSPSAKGRKLFDANQVDSLAIESRNFYVLPINTNGAGYCEIRPTLVDEFISVNGLAADMTAAGVLGPAVTSTTSSSNLYTDISAQVYQYRVVSYGIKISPIQSPLTRQGRVLIREIPWQGTQVANSINEMRTAQENYYCSLTDADLQIMPEAIGLVQSEYLDIDMTIANAQTRFNDLPFNTIGITVVGGSATVNSTPCLTVEVVKQLEVIPLITSALRLAVTDAAPHSSVIQETVNNIRNAAPMAHPVKTFSSNLKGYARSAVGQLAQYGGRFALNALSRYLLGPVPSLLALTNGRTPMEVD